MKMQLTSPLRIEARAQELQQGGEIAIAAARESLKIRATQTASSGRVVLIGASLIAAAYSFSLPMWRVAGWVIPVIVSAIISTRACRKILAHWRPNLDANEIARSEARLFFYVVIRNVIMGSGIWWTGLGVDNDHIWFITTTVVVLYTLVALINSSTNPTSYIAGAYYNLGLTAAFWLTTGAAGLAVAVTMIGLLYLFRKCAFQLHADFVKFVTMGFENIELARRLEIEKHNAIAAQHQAEAAQRKAEEANLGKSRFLAAASHDLRQPLHALLLFSSLLDDNSTADQRKALLSHIRTAAESLNHLFGGLLDLSRLDAGAISPKLTQVNLAPLLESLGAEFAAKARQKGLVFHVQNIGVAAHTDPFFLERVLRNLLDNALKYTHGGSIKLSAVHDGENVRIDIEDSGVGIDKQFHESIFSEFYQLGNPERNPEHGTGLGLSIVRRLCELMRHDYEIDSTPGVGSRFSIFLQTANAPTMEPAFESTTIEKITNHEALIGLRILVVDDDLRVRTAMEHLLLGWRCEVFSAESQQEMENLISSLTTAPQALIADYRLANHHHGFEVIQYARKHWPDLPAAIFTGDTEANWRDAANMKDVPIFQKPVEADEIARWLISVAPVRATTQD